MGAGAAGGLRIGDSDRDQISAVLGQHAAQGRLTMEELDERLGVLYAAQTRAQAAAVLADLPPLKKTQHIRLGHDHNDGNPTLPEWLTVAGPRAEQPPAPRPGSDMTLSTIPRPAGEDRAAARRRAKRRQDENAIGHTFQATRRAIDARLVAATDAGSAADVTDLTDRLRNAQDLAAAARQAVSAGDRAEVQRLLSRLRSLA